MAYNSTANILSFLASGQTGTTGYAEIVVPKELCVNISNMKVYVDDVETEFGYISVDVYWVVTVVDQHSTHDIQVTIPVFFICANRMCNSHDCRFPLVTLENAPKNS